MTFETPSLKKDVYDSDRGDDHGFSTIALHHGQPYDSDNRARAPPIYNTATFGFKSAKHGAKLFALQELGPIYTRLGNPTTHMLEYRIAKLEGAKCELDGVHPSALGTSSGMAAQFHAITTICSAGDNIIAGNNLYGGTFAQFKHTLPNVGIDVKFFNVSNLDEIRHLVDSNTKGLYVETIANPSYVIPDFDAIKALCNEFEIPLIVDNTFGMCGYVCRPIKFGADIIVESCTKWIGGHGTTIGGVIVDAGTFDWSTKKEDGSSKFPSLNEPCKAYHNMNFNQVFGPEGPFKVNMPFIFHARVVALRDLGGCPNPMGSFQLLQGLETLGLRGNAHCQNANKLANYLSTHPEVDWVKHASLPSHQSHELAKKYFRKNCFGGVLSFGLKGDGKTRGAKFMDSLKLASALANVGDAKTLVVHPSSTTHQQLSDEEQNNAGVLPSMIRVSVGIEDYEDIVADFEQAIDASKKQY